MKNREHLLFKKAFFTIMNCHMKSKIVAMVCQGKLNSKIPCSASTVMVFDRHHTGIELLHGGKDFLECTFLAVIGLFGQCDFIESHVESFKLRCFFRKTCRGISFFEILDQKTLEVVEDMRTAELLRNIERIFYAMRLHDTQKLRHFCIMRFRSEVEDDFSRLLSWHDIVFMENFIVCGFSVFAHGFMRCDF